MVDVVLRNQQLSMIIGGLMHDSISLHNNSRMGKNPDLTLIKEYTRKLIEARNELIQEVLNGD